MRRPVAGGLSPALPIIVTTTQGETDHEADRIRPHPGGRHGSDCPAGSAFDPATGNAYRTAKATDGTTTVNGYSFETGSTWLTVIDPDGDMRGVDSADNVWQYDSRTGNYWNADGRICTGKGAARSCN